MINPERFAGRRALVTGAAKGIGRATAMRLNAEGASVALIDLDLAGAQSAVAELTFPEQAIAVGADCADEAQISAAVGAAAERFGGLDVIIANAGIEMLAAEAPVHQLELVTWERLLTTNLNGQFLTCKYGVRALLDAGGGTVVCLGSNCGHLGIARGEPAYSASKGGVLAMMRVMAADYIGAGIRVNMVVPGLIDTPMNAPVFAEPDEMRYWLEQLPIARAGRADEVAAAICWLASDDATYCVGTVLVVDGGQAAI
jgi:NAD(P)-dependent dehydrogenase (short-subunit alcohol dehydrogenase family)